MSIQKVNLVDFTIIKGQLFFNSDRLEAAFDQIAVDKKAVFHLRFAEVGVMQIGIMKLTFFNQRFH
ncbi:hypothetical protein LOT_0730 [Lentilactobacillus otakiensis DSM 19908 = JCM 15040]|uniref:Uncharacterized protein n=1 Tax=Lentilactobacillus otakiensis DSM 19908 = JCM 15040 TaxID=1423780 RepID=S4NG39_9LACO|nr:hypothetical protein LOT_0730 [Lentilactobacillus otakiensis DSM 19908 = JCM 15040]